MDNEVYSFALKNTLNEIQNICPDIKNSFMFKEDGEIVVGKNAKEYAYVHPERTVRWIKRKMGTNYTMEIDGYKYTPQEISALIIKKIKRDAETYLGENIDKAVISAPAYFNNNQRNATKEAAEIAGLEVLRIVSEPTAASLAYGLDKIRKNLIILKTNTV